MKLDFISSKRPECDIRVYPSGAFHIHTELVHKFKMSEKGIKIAVDSDDPKRQFMFLYICEPLETGGITVKKGGNKSYRFTRIPLSKEILQKHNSCALRYTQIVEIEGKRYLKFLVIRSNDKAI
jgi:hypothetical protein